MLLNCWWSVDDVSLKCWCSVEVLSEILLEIFLKWCWSVIEVLLKCCWSVQVVDMFLTCCWSVANFVVEELLRCCWDVVDMLLIWFWSVVDNYASIPIPQVFGIKSRNFEPLSGWGENFTPHNASYINFGPFEWEWREVMKAKNFKPLEFLEDLFPTPFASQKNFRPLRNASSG